MGGSGEMYDMAAYNRAQSMYNSYATDNAAQWRYSSMTDVSQSSPDSISTTAGKIFILHFQNSL